MTLAVGSKCGIGQLEVFSYDCWNHCEDEDWNIYWWYVLEQNDVTTLNNMLATCPDPENSQCICDIHTTLCSYCERL